MEIDLANEGRQVPVVLLPRFTTLLGRAKETFPTLPLDVTAFEGARITLWRATMHGTNTPTAYFHLEESTDRLMWSPCGTTGEDGVEIDAAETEQAVAFVFTKKWFRARVELKGTNPAVTCWAQGFLLRRQR